jgi:hypothetical protein
MSVTDEELMAFVDGELAGEEAARVEAAIAADPELIRRVDAERKLRAMLRGHLDPVAEEPVPESWTAMIAAAAKEDSEAGRAKVVSLAAARTEKARQAAIKAKEKARARPFMQQWGTGVAIAASLVLGVFVGTQLTLKSPVTERDGALLAAGSLRKGLDMQLASAGDEGAVRILTSFQRGDGDYCRVFASDGTSGIACKDDRGWVLERTINGGPGQGTEYRKAGSTQAELMAAAQNMAAGAPLDAEQEKAAKAKDWRD